jgi:hypothetical protein
MDSAILFIIDFSLVVSGRRPWSESEDAECYHWEGELAITFHVATRTFYRMALSAATLKCEG